MAHDARNEAFTKDQANRGGKSAMTLFPPPFGIRGRSSKLGSLDFLRLRRGSILPSMEKPDQLHERFRMQELLNRHIGIRTDGMNEAEKTQCVLD